ncbi:putative uridine cytidine [Phaeomoniella chlamydospora]|uniref:Putative uridine cytidine n=1 Tax=Phaeomoniella chlamydospora TaxID=158046 RepID=A0A0G2G7X0_PHACM|nr:putative uridine cytidine [Phaeomoniella chlamydospora]
MPNIVDDKSEYCTPFILDRLKVHSAKHEADSNPPPFFLGLNGVQGAGKTVLQQGLPTVVFSMDDIYLAHDDQLNLAKTYSDNPLLQHRGQPPTHDLQLGLSVFESLRYNKPTKIPQYNKAAFNGQGDRVPECEWEEVNNTASKIKVVLFEGWCTGFRPLDQSVLKQKWEEAIKAKQSGSYNGRLAYNRLEDLTVINQALKSYNALTDQLDALIHIDAADSQYVYQWRLQQEATLRAAKGTGMTDEQVHHFVDGYYPSYELFSDTLRAGIFGGDSGRQLRLVVGPDRKVKEVIRI